MVSGTIIDEWSVLGSFDETSKFDLQLFVTLSGNVYNWKSEVRVSLPAHDWTREAISGYCRHCWEAFTLLWRLENGECWVHLSSFSRLESLMYIGIWEMVRASLRFSGGATELTWHIMLTSFSLHEPPCIELVFLIRSADCFGAPLSVLLIIFYLELCRLWMPHRLSHYHLEDYLPTYLHWKGNF